MLYAFIAFYSFDWLTETESSYVAQAGLKLAVLKP